MSPRLVVVNEAAWKTLSAPHQALLRDALTRHGRAQDAEIVRQESMLAETFAKAGMTVVTPDVDSFRKPVLASVPGKFASKLGAGLWDRVSAA